MEEEIQRIAAQIAQLAEDSLLEALKQTGVIEDSVILGITTQMSWWAWVCAPSQKIHKAFGSDVALYFAWMNFFQLWLLIPSLVGGYVYHLRIEEGVSIDDDQWAPVYAWPSASLGGVVLQVLESSRSSSGRGPRRRFIGERRWCAAGLPGRAAAVARYWEVRRYSPPIYRHLAYILSIIVTGLMLRVALLWHVISLNLQGYITSDYIGEQDFYREDVAKYAQKVKSSTLRARISMD